MKAIALLVLALVAIVSVGAISPLAGVDGQDTPCQNDITIIDDANLSQQLAQARKTFLATRPHPFTRLDSAILIPNQDGTWSRGGYNFNNVAYPASCIKLTYLVAAANWCLQNNMRFDCLDPHVRPMITISSNFETGVIVDVVSGATNYPATTANNTEFQNWLAKRRYTADLLNSKGLLENQTVLHKTYPANSGYDPNGAEALARATYGMNALNPKCTASLMLEIVEGKLVPEAQTYMMHLLQHDRTSVTSYGPGLPPGSVIYTKLGNAYDTIEEIAYVVLPNGKRFILTTFTNGYEPTEPTIDTLSYYASLVIQGTSLAEGLPVSVVYTAKDRDILSLAGSWQQATATDMYGNLFYTCAKSNASVTAQWTFKVPEDGIYELSVWAPENAGNSKSVTHTVSHLDGNDAFGVDQTVHGGRFTKLGDFRFSSKTSGSVTISNTGSFEKAMAVNALKLAKWPECNGVPGTSCAVYPHVF